MNYLPLSYYEEDSYDLRIFVIVFASCYITGSVFAIGYEFIFGGVIDVQQKDSFDSSKIQVDLHSNDWVQLRALVIKDICKNISYDDKYKFKFAKVSSDDSSSVYFKNENTSVEKKVVENKLESKNNQDLKNDNNNKNDIKFNLAYMYDNSQFMELRKSLMITIRALISKEQVIKQVDIFKKQDCKKYVYTIEDYIVYYFVKLFNLKDFEDNTMEFIYLTLGLKLYMQLEGNFLLVKPFKDDVVENNIKLLRNLFPANMDNILLSLSFDFINEDNISSSITGKDIIEESNYLDASCVYLFLNEVNFNFIDKNRDNSLFYLFLSRLSKLNHMKVRDMINFSKSIGNFYNLFVEKLSFGVKDVSLLNAIYIVDLLCDVFRECGVNDSIDIDIIYQFVLINCMDDIVDCEYNKLSKDHKNKTDYYVPYDAFEKLTILKLNDKLSWLKFDDLFLLNNKKINDKIYNDIIEFYDNTKKKIQNPKADTTKALIEIQAEIKFNNKTWSTLGYHKDFFNKLKIYRTSVDNSFNKRISNFLFRHTVSKYHLIDLIFIYNNYEVFKFVLDKIKEHLSSNGRYKEDNKKHELSNIIDEMYRVIEVAKEDKNPMDLIQLIKVFTCIFDKNCDLFDDSNDDLKVFREFYTDFKNGDKNIDNQIIKLLRKLKKQIGGSEVFKKVFKNIISNIIQNMTGGAGSAARLAKDPLSNSVADGIMKSLMDAI